MVIFKQINHHFLNNKKVFVYLHDLKKRIVSMNKIVYCLLFILCGFNLFAQDPFDAAKSLIAPDGINISVDSSTTTNVIINVTLTKDGEMSHYKFKEKDLYRYKYVDTTSVFGTLSLLNLNDNTDVAFFSSLCDAAKKDANTYYKMYKAPAYGTLALTSLAAPIGLAVAFPAAKTTPKIENLGMPNLDLLHERIYYQTYSQEAKKIKAKKVWTCFGIGVGINLGIIFGILAIANN